ncbi:MAG: T9SS type A sorting domain-containing protein [Flavobacteriales bacterium]|nr:T9SS type A sorting domain-containing protein [Flavobacteriales bacterium]
MKTPTYSILMLLFFIGMRSTDAQTPQLDWAYALGGSSIDATVGHTTDLSGNIYSIGYFSGTLDLNPGPGFLNVSSAGSTDIFIQKMDASGNFIWGKRIGGIWADRANDIAVDNLGNVFITGGFKNTVDFDPGSGVYNQVADNTFQTSAAFVVKLNSSGSFQWARTADTESEGYALDTDNSGNVYVGGRITNWVDFGNTSIGGDAFLWKLNSSGDQQWVKALDDVTSPNSLYIAQHGLKVDGSGNMYVTGRFDETQDFVPGNGVQNLVSTGGDDVFLAKYNSSCVLQWVKQFGGTGSDYGLALHRSSVGDLYIGGAFSGISDFDPSSGTGQYAFQSAGSTDIFVLKTNSNGDVQWASAFGGSAFDYAGDITANSIGEVVITGLYQGTADFDPDLVNTLNMTAVGGEDIFIEKLSATGELQWARSFGSTGDDNGLAVHYHGNNLYAGGDFAGTADFDPSSSVYNLTSSSSTAAYILKFGECTATSSSISPVSCGAYTSPSGNYTWTTTDTYLDTIPNSAGCDSVITINLTVQDNEAPVPDQQTLSDITEQCVIASLSSPTATDNCAGAITGTHNVTLPITVSTTITWTYDDGNGNTSTQTQNVTINDITAPVADQQTLQNISAQCEVSSLTAPTATDNCAGTVTGTHNATLPITASSVITWTYDDGNSNTSTQTQTVTINDITAPVPNVQNLADMTEECEITNLPLPTADDNCDGTVAGLPNVTLPITSSTTITWTYEDGSGNTSTQTQNVVINDVTAPVADEQQLSDITEQCQVTSLSAPTATDNCVGSVTGTHNLTLPITTSTTITWTYDDGNGNTSTQTQNVVISDLVAPVADQQLLPDLTSQCEITSLTEPTATDNCAGTIIGTHNTSLPITTSATITWTYDDGNGNTTTQTQSVIVSDFTSPVPDAANLPDVTAQCQVPFLTAPTATDNCAGSITGTHNANLPITSSTTVTWSFDDGNGNISTQPQNVVINDITAPIPSLANLPDLTDECEIASLTTPTATDNCEGLISGTHDVTLPITASTTITWTYDDGNGNTTSQMQEVTITPINNSVTQVDATTLTADANGYNYQWVDCNNGNSPITGETDQTFLATTNGSYAVEIDNGSCSVTSACTQILTVGQEDINQESVRVYPNPTRGPIWIEVSDLSIRRFVSVYDLAGKELYSLKLNNSNSKLELQVPSGTYILKIADDFNRSNWFRLVKTD